MEARTHKVQIGPLTLELPIKNVAGPDEKPTFIAYFNPRGKHKLNRLIGIELAKLVPHGTTAIVMPAGKAEGLLQVVGELTGLPTFVAVKQYKHSMGKALSQNYVSITTGAQTVYLSEEDAAALEGQNVLLLDDVVSTGGTMDAIKDLLAQVGATCAGVLVAFTEGKERADVISLGHLPLF